MFGKKFLLNIITFIFLIIVACSDESDQITKSQDSISNEDIIGTWQLREIKYPSGENEITVLPENEGISMTLKFFDTKTGQMITIENGSTDIDNFTWNILGTVVEIIYDNGDWEPLRCRLIKGDLQIEYGFETNEDNMVLASYIFDKEIQKL
ncbi:MAG: lipocalin family protein [Ignavibacteriaceae bacterium]